MPDILVIVTVAWNNLSAQEQQLFQEAADEAKTYQRELWLKAEQEALDAVQAAGVAIIRPDKSPFFEKTKELLDAYKDQPEKYALIQEIQAIQ